MKKPLVVFAFVFAIGVAAAFVAGARVGGRELFYADAQYKAAILAWQLHALRAGNDEALLERLENSLDDELARHALYLESGFRWLWPDMNDDDDKAIRDGVAYRLANPHEADSETAAYRAKVLARYKP